MCCDIYWRFHYIGKCESLLQKKIVLNSPANMQFWQIAQSSTGAHTATHSNTQQHDTRGRHSPPLPCCNTLQYTATHLNTLPHTATYCKRLEDTATHCNTEQHTATHCNALQQHTKGLHSSPMPGCQEFCFCAKLCVCVGVCVRVYVCEYSWVTSQQGTQ